MFGDADDISSEEEKQNEEEEEPIRDERRSDDEHEEKEVRSDVENEQHMPIIEDVSTDVTLNYTNVFL